VNKWVIRGIGLLIVILSLAAAQIWPEQKSLIDWAHIHFTSSVIALIFGVGTFLAPNNEDIVSRLERLIKIPTRILLAKAGVNYDAREQENSGRMDTPAPQSQPPVQPGPGGYP